MVDIQNGISYSYQVSTVLALKPGATTMNATNMTVANTILAQLGGRVFIAMTGAKNLVGGENFLMFSIPSRKINKVKITLTPADDYTVECFKIHGANVAKRATFEGVYCDQLQEVFTDATGLYTRF